MSWIVAFFGVDKSKDVPLDKNFEILGYENTSLVYGNLGSNLIFLFMIVVFIVLTDLVVK